MKVLLKNQWKIQVNTFRSLPTKNYVSYFIMLVIVGILLYYISKGVIAVGENISDSILAGILSYAFITVIGFIILLGLPQVFKHLYAATDLDLLFTMPIPTRHIFWIKYIQSFAGIPLLGFILLAIPLVIYGVVIEANLLYYPVVLLVLLSIIVVALSIAYLFNLVLIQIVPASKANEFMTVMSLLSGVFVYLLFMIPNLSNARPLNEMILSGLPLFPKWVPVTWASQAIIQVSNGSMDFIVPFVMTLLLAGVFILVTSTLVEKGFRTGWVRLSEGSGKKKKVKTKGNRSKLHHPIIAVGKKEWFAIKRDMREWIIFMPILFFLVFGFIGFVSGGANLSDLQGNNEISWPIAQGIFLFMYAMFNGPMTSSTIAREAHSVWILQVLPLSGKNIALGKLWISWLIPFLILTAIEIVVGVFLGWTVIQFISGIAMKAIITVGICGLGMWFGTIGAKYNPSNPQNRLNFSTSIILMISSYVYLILSLIPYVLLIIPVGAIGFFQEVSQNAAGFWGWVMNSVLQILLWKSTSPMLVNVIGILVMVVLSLGIAYIFTMASARNIDKGIKIEMVRESRGKGLFGKTGRL